MIGDAGNATPTNPLGIPGLDLPSVIPNLNPQPMPPAPSGGGGSPTAVTTAATQAYAQGDAASQEAIYGYVTKNGRGASLFTRDRAIVGGVGAVVGATLLYLLRRR